MGGPYGGIENSTKYYFCNLKFVFGNCCPGLGLGLIGV